MASVRRGPYNRFQKMHAVGALDVVGEPCEFAADVIVYANAGEGAGFACDFCI